jgi:hypothetical protein
VFCVVSVTMMAQAEVRNGRVEARAACQNASCSVCDRQALSAGEPPEVPTPPRARCCCRHHRTSPLTRYVAFVGAHN